MNLFTLLFLLSFTAIPAEEKPRETVKSASTEDWPTFRGSPDLKGFRAGSISDSPRLIWRYDAGTAVESTAALVDGVAYIGTTEGQLLALDLLTVEKRGKLLWKHTIEAGIRSSPGVRKGKVYFGDDFGVFHAVDAKTGAKVWNFDTEGGAEIISSPTFTGDTVLFGSYDNHLFCLAADTGKLRWKVLTGGPVHSTPAVAKGKTFVTGCDELLRVLDVKTGKELMQMEMGAYSSASPAVFDDTLYVGTFANNVIAVDCAAGKLLWSYEHPTRQFPFAASPAVTEKYVVVGGRDKMIHALRRDSGVAHWSFSTRARIECSPLIVGNRVLCGSSDKTLYLLELETGKEVWSYEGDGAFLASPALARGRVVISSESGLVYCFDVSGGAAKKP